MSGDGVVAHNRRTYFAENVDQTRTHLNIEYCYTPIEDAYHQLFDAAVFAFLPGIELCQGVIEQVVIRLFDRGVAVFNVQMRPFCIDVFGGVGASVMGDDALAGHSTDGAFDS